MSQAQELAQEKFNSVLPFLPPLEEKTLSQYYWIYVGLVAAIITFGGLASPILEVKLGLGGESPPLGGGGLCLAWDWEVMSALSLGGGMPAPHSRL